jgi:hypothetical protein
VIFALTYGLTAVLRNGLKGLGASFLIMTGLNGVVIAADVRWKVHLPMPSDRIGNLPMAASALVWIIIALLFIFAAQMLTERAEI